MQAHARTDMGLLCAALQLYTSVDVEPAFLEASKRRWNLQSP